MTIPALFSFCLCISFQLLDLDRVVRSFLAAFADPPRPARMTVFPCLFGLLFQRFSYFLISLIAQLSGWVGALMILVNEIDPRIRFSLKPGSYSVSVSIFWKASWLQKCKQIGICCQALRKGKCVFYYSRQKARNFRGGSLSISATGT